jgi:hypothetical protein
MLRLNRLDWIVKQESASATGRWALGVGGA